MVMTMVMVMMTMMVIMNIICDAAMIINSNAVTTSLAGDSIIMTTCSGASTRPMLNKIGVNALAIVEAVVEGMLAIFVLRFAVAYECWHMLLLGASPVRAVVTLANVASK